MAVVVSTGYASRILGPHSFPSIFQDGCMEIRTGAQPGSADMPPTGALVGRITRDGGAWTAGSPANGLRFGLAVRFVAKAAGHAWQLRGLATGVAGWCRLLGNPYDAGEFSTDMPRIDGAVGLVSGAGDAQLRLPSLNITTDTLITIDQWWYAVPPLGD